MLYPHHPQKLSYFLSKKQSILIVSLIGPLIRENAHVLEECIREVEATPAEWVILNFRDVPAPMDKALFPALARLYKMLSSKRESHLRISSLHPDLRIPLLESGIFHADDLSNNLSEALVLISSGFSKAA